MNTILMSIKPEYVEKIFSGQKKYEYRKTQCKQKINKIIIYSSSPIKKIVGELIINEILYNKKDIIWNKTNKYSGINKDKYDKYFKNKEYAIAYKIKNFIKYKIPKNLIDYGIKSPPQSFIYITNK